MKITGQQFISQETGDGFHSSVFDMYGLEVKVTMVRVKGHLAQGQIRVQNICRWAHFLRPPSLCNLHSGLLCIAFRLLLDQKSLDNNSHLDKYGS